MLRAVERRRVLAGLGVAGAALALEPVLVACTSDSSGEPAATTSPTAGATGAVVDPRAAAASIESDLVTLTANVQARWPATAVVLAGVQSAHTAHVVALVGTTPSPTAPTDVSDPRLPGSAAAALRAVATAERKASAAHAGAAETAPGADARLLSSIAAYAAAQDVLVTRASTTAGIGR